MHVGTGPAGAARGAHRTPRGTAVPAAPCVHVHARTCDPRPFSAHARSVHTHVPFRTRAADARTDAPAAHARDSRALARCDGAWPGRKWAWPTAEGRGLQEVGVAPPRSDSNLKHELSRPKLFPRRADVSPAGPRAANGRSRTDVARRRRSLRAPGTAPCSPERPTKGGCRSPTHRGRRRGRCDREPGLDWGLLPGDVPQAPGPLGRGARCRCPSPARSTT